MARRPHRRTNRLTPVGTALPDLARALEAARDPQLAWAAAVGGPLRHHTRVLSEEAGELRVAVRDTAWKAHLEALAPAMLARVARSGLPRLRRIRFVVAPESLEPAPKAPPRPGTRPVPVAALRQVKEAGVTRPRLAEAIARAMAAHLEDDDL